MDSTVFIYIIWIHISVTINGLILAIFNSKILKYRYALSVWNIQIHEHANRIFFMTKMFLTLGENDSCQMEKKTQFF